MSRPELPADEGVLDYVSEGSREYLDAVHEEVHKLGFRHHEIIISAASALRDLHVHREYLNFIEEPGDLRVQA